MTEQLVPEVLEDVAKVTIDYRLARMKDKKQVDTGGFRLVCKEKELDTRVQNNVQIGMQLELVGQNMKKSSRKK